MRDWKERKVESFNSSWPVFWLFCLILVLPVWLVDYPPMVDLPGHASQIQLMHNLLDESFLYADVFERYYITPYAGVYFIVYLLSFVFGVLAALKIIITISLLGIPFFTKKIIDHFGGNPAWIWLCFPVAYSNAFYWGFLNYILTVAIGLGWIFFCLKVSERERLTWRVQLAIALGVIILFIGHIIACGMLGLVVAIYYFFLDKTVKQRFLLLTPLLIFIPLLISYLWWTRTGESRGLGSQTRLYYYPERYKEALSLLVGRTTWWSELAGLALLVTPFLAGGVLTSKLSRLLPFVVIVLFVLLLPMNIFGLNLVYPRFYVFVVPLLLFALDHKPEKSGTFKNLLPLVIASVVMSVNTADFIQFGNQHQDYNKVIEQTEPDSRIFKVIFNSASTAGEFSTLPVYDHFPSWHHLRGKGLVDFNFASFGRMPVSYMDPLKTKVPRYGFSWVRHRGNCYDYFISRADVDPFFAHNGGLGKYRDKVDLVSSSGSWFLHKNKSPTVCN